MFCDESEDGFGWIADEPPWLERTSHAIAAGGGVWLVDPVDYPASMIGCVHSVSREPSFSSTWATAATRPP